MGIVHSCYSEGALNEYLTDVVSSSMLLSVSCLKYVCSAAAINQSRLKQFIAFFPTLS